MAAKRYTYGIRIEGVGSDVTKTGGICWAYGLPLSSAQRAASSFEWIGGNRAKKGLLDIPQASTSKTELFTAKLTASAHQFQLLLEDTSGVALMKRQLEPVGYVDEGLDVNETTVSLSSAFDSDDYEDTVVFLGDEAMRLNTHGGGGVFGVTRAVWGTRAHPLPKYTRVYTALPYRKARVVTLIRFDHADDSETTRWFGLLEDAPGTNANHTTLVADTAEIVRFIRDALVNTGAPSLDSASHAATRKGYISGAVGTGTQPRHHGTVRLTPARVRTKDLGATHWGAFQIGGGLVFGKLTDGSGAPNAIYTTHRDTTTAEDDGAGMAMLGSRIDPQELAPMHELFVVAREFDYADGTRKDAADMRSSTASLAYPHHFLSIFLAFALSGADDNGTGYDILGPELGLDCDPAWFDIADIESVIEQTEEIEIDTLIVGWDGEPFSPWRFLEQECRARGMFPVTRTTGQISVRIAREAGPEEVLGDGAPTVTALPDTLEWMPSEADGVDIISGRFGELPWRKGRPYSLEILDWTDPENPVPQNSRRFGLLASVNESRLDMPTRQSLGISGEALLGLAAARHIAAPAIRVEVEDTGFGHGDFVRLGELDIDGDVLRDTDGVKVAVDSSARWVGLVVGKRPLYETETAEIWLKLVNFYLNDFPRWRAPAAVVASVAGGTVVTVESGDDAFTTDDAAKFTDGAQVEAWTRYGQRRSGSVGSPDVRTVTVTDTRELTLSSAFTTALQAGDVIRLARLYTGVGYPEDGNPNLFDTDGLEYTYAADAAGTIGPNDDEGHRYATWVSP